MKHTYTAVISGEISCTPLNITGKGEFDIANGIVIGSYDLLQVPKGLDPIIFNSVKITGYPSVCQPKGNTINPFGNKSYRYHRELDFGKHGKLSYDAKCKNSDTESGDRVLHSTFYVEGSLATPKLMDPLPIDEAWQCIDSTTILGEFTITWPTECGGRVTAKANTSYELESRLNSCPTYFSREISIKNHCDAENQISIYQKSILEAKRQTPD